MVEGKIGVRLLPIQEAYVEEKPANGGEAKEEEDVYSRHHRICSFHNNI